MAKGISTCSDCRDVFDQVWDIEWSRNPFDARNLFQAPDRVRQVVAEGRYDLVHVHTPVASFVSRFALRNCNQSIRPKIIYTAHGFHFFRGGKALNNGLYLVLEKIAGKWTDYLVVMNREDFESARKHRIVNPERVTFMRGIGVDTGYYNNNLVPAVETNLVRLELGLNSDDRLFLMVAEFIPRKRHEDVLRAFAKLDCDHAHIGFAGTGPLLEQIKALAGELKISDRVHVLGFRKDIPVLLRASVGILLPSLHEGLPRSLMEAMCLEIPCIGSNIRGTSDLLESGRGLLVDVGDIEGFRAAMAWILENPADAREMALKGRAGMAEYDTEKIIQMHEALYHQALTS